MFQYFKKWQNVKKPGVNLRQYFVQSDREQCFRQKEIISEFFYQKKTSAFSPTFHKFCNDFWSFLPNFPKPGSTGSLLRTTVRDAPIQILYFWYWYLHWPIFDTNDTDGKFFLMKFCSSTLNTTRWNTIKSDFLLIIF